MKNRHHIMLLNTAIARAALLALPIQAGAQTTQTWDNGAGNFLWDTASSNWGGATWNNVATNSAIFGPTGVGTITLNETLNIGSLTFDTAGYTIDGASTLTLAPTSVITANADAAISAVLGGAADLTKAGGATLSLTGSNSFTGSTIVQGGTLMLGPGAIRAGTFTVDSGATLEVNIPSVNFNLGANWDLLQGAGTFKKTGDFEFRYNSGGSSVAMGSGGLIHIAEGAFDFGGGGAGDWSTNLSDMQVDGGAQFDGSATAIVVNALSGSGNVLIGGNGANSALTVGIGDASSTFSGNIGNSSEGSNFSLSKVGSGTLTLSGTNTYSGRTRIASGGIVTSGNGIPDTGIVELADVSGVSLQIAADETIGTLTGGGTTGGTVDLLSTLTIAGGTADNFVGSFAGTVNSSGAGNLVIANGGRLNMAGSLGSTPLTVQAGGILGGESSTTGATTFSGGGLALDASTAEEFQSGDLDISGDVVVLLEVAPAGVGPFSAISYTGTLTTDGTVGGDVTVDFDFSALGGNSRASATDNGGTIELDLGIVDNTWTNTNGDGIWDSTTSNWNNSTDSVFQGGDLVTFGDTGAGTVTISGADVTASLVTFANTVGNDYIINSAAGETLTAANGINMPDTGNVTINSIIAGGTSINHNGTGILSLSGTNTFTGGVTVGSGSTLVTANNGSALGGVGSGLTLASGGQWNASGGNFSALGAGGITLAGTGTGGSGALVNTTNALTLGGINLTGSATIDSAAALTINNLSVSGTGHALTLFGVGTTATANPTTLTGDNSTTAADLSQIINEAGFLIVGNANALGGAELVMNAGGLRLASGTYNNDFVYNSSAGLVAGNNGRFIFADGGSLTMNQSAQIGGAALNDAVTFAGVIAGSGDITLGRSGSEGNLIAATADLTGYTGRFRLTRSGPGNNSDLFINNGRILTQEVVIADNGNLNTPEKVIGAISGSVEFAGQIILQEDNAGSFDIRANSGETITISGNVTTNGNDCGIDVIGTGGTVILSGTNTYNGGTRVQSGTLSIPSGGSLLFLPTANGVIDSLSGSATATLNYLGTVDLDLSAAAFTDGNSWTLVDLASFSGPVPTFSPEAVTSNLGSFTEDPENPGTWELETAIANWTFNEVDGSLFLEVTATPYELWALSFDPVIGLPEEDDDNDGVSNFEEYAFGLLPNSGASVNPIAVPLDKSNGTFSYTRRTDSGLTYSVWFTETLASWTEDTGAIEGTPVPNGDNETVEVTLSSLPGDPLPASLFIQVRAE